MLQAIVPVESYLDINISGAIATNDNVCFVTRVLCYKNTPYCLDFLIKLGPEFRQDRDVVREENIISYEEWHPDLIWRGKERNNSLCRVRVKQRRKSLHGWWFIMGSLHGRFRE